jgi:beta-lactamase class A
MLRPLPVSLLSRRSLLLGASALAVPLGCHAQRSPTQSPEADAFQAELVAIERRLGGRVGVAAVDTGDGRRLAYRGGERVAMCSTFKLPLVAAVLARVDASDEDLTRRVPFGKADLLEYAPVTRTRIADGGMTVDELCAAAVTVSDNTAANLLLPTIGGPAGLTQYFRRLGDSVSRLDRNEPLLNTALADDDRDTTTPDAMSSVLQRVLVEDALSTASRERLIAWMVDSTTGRARLRAGLPATWRVGDKTGTGERGATGDVGIAYPPSRAPILLAAYLVGSDASIDDRNRVFAAIANAMRRALSIPA